MKNLVFSLTVQDNPIKAVLQTNLELGERFTVMTVNRPAVLTEDVFPFKPGDVLSISEVAKFVAEAEFNGTLNVTKVIIEDSEGTKDIDIPTICRINISVNNEGATLLVNGVVVEDATYSGLAAKGDTITYKASLEGYITVEDTIHVADEDVTEEITLEQEA